MPFQNNRIFNHNKILSAGIPRPAAGCGVRRSKETFWVKHSPERVIPVCVYPRPVVVEVCSGKRFAGNILQQLSDAIHITSGEQIDYDGAEVYIVSNVQFSAHLPHLSEGRGIGTTLSLGEAYPKGCGLPDTCFANGNHNAMISNCIFVSHA